MIYLIVFTGTIVSGLVQTITGFGAGILMMMYLPYFFGMIQAPALSSCICLGLNMALAWKYRDTINIRMLFVPFVFYVSASLEVIRIVKSLDMRLISILFGVFLILVALYFLFLSRKKIEKVGFLLTAFCALFSGLSSGLFGIGGPLMSIYFLEKTDNSKSYTGNMQMFFSITSLFSLTSRIVKGIYTVSLIPLTIIGIIGINIGKKVAIPLLEKTDPEKFKKIIYIAVGLAGIINIIEHI